MSLVGQGEAGQGGAAGAAGSTTLASILGYSSSDDDVEAEAEAAGAARPLHASHRGRFGGRGWRKAPSRMRATTPPQDAPPPGMRRLEEDTDCVGGGVLFSLDDDEKQLIMYAEQSPLTHGVCPRPAPEDGPLVWIENRSYTTAQYFSGCVGALCAVEVSGNGENRVVIAVIEAWHASAGIVELVPVTVDPSGTKATWCLDASARVYVPVIDAEEWAPPVGPQQGQGQWGGEIFLLNQIR